MIGQLVDDLTGKQLGKYRLVQRIAQGGSGTVYKARTAEDKFSFAIKILNPELDVRKFSGPMNKEYEICKELRNQRILKYFDIGSYEDRPFFVMEYFEGDSIGKLLKNEEKARMLQARAHEIVQHMAEAVAYVHLQGIIHRDIKADNFMYSEEKQDVKLIDFSTAVRAHRGILSLLNFTKPAIVGTPSYMAPEQINRKRPTVSADIYSFGAMLFEIFTGRPPFTGNSQNEILSKILKSPAPQMNRMNPDVSMDFNNLVKNMLAKSPEQRPHSMEHFLSAFTRIPIFKT